MNIQNDLSYFIDGTYEFMGGGLSGGSTNSNITIGSGSNGTLDKYLYVNSNNLYLANPNNDGGIYFKTQQSSNATYGNYDFSVKIDKNGKLYVYHLYNPFNPQYGAGFYDVESELIGLKFNADLQQIELTALGAAVAVIEAQITDIYATIGVLFKALGEVNNNLQFTQDMLYDNGALNQANWQIMTHRDNYNSLMEDFVGDAIGRSVKTRVLENRANIVNSVSTLTNYVSVGAVAVPIIGGIVAGIYSLIQDKNTYNTASNISNANFDITKEQRRQLLDSNLLTSVSNTVFLTSNLSNLNIFQGFINSNVATTQFIPQLKSNKVLLGNITTPNSSYQMEMTGDLNLNQLYINSTSLTSLLNQKQDNISTTAPIYLTTGNIGINYDSSLTKIGNNLSVASATASKWTTSGNNIYNNNTANVGIGSLLPQEKLDVNGNTFINGITTIGVPKINPAISSSGGTGGASLILVPNSDPAEYYQEFTLGGGTIVLSEPCSADILCVGAGGNGGTGASSGGGGAGEVIYYPNFPLRAGTLNIQVGASGTNTTNRISRIYPSSGNEVLRAKGGGDGGSFTSFTSSGSATVNENTIAIFNYTTTINISPATYTITFSQGSITLSGLTVNKSYPLLKDANNNTINPVVWYKFDNAGLTIDSSGTYTLTNNSATLNTTTFAKGDSSISFNGSSQYVSNTSFYNLNGISFSISFWCYSSISTNGNINIVGSFGEILSSQITTTNYIQIGNFYGRWSVGGIFNPSATQVEDLNTWVHLVYTFNSVGATKEEKLYKNGSLYHSASTMTTNWNLPNQVMEIGRRTLTNSRLYWNGLIDDYRIYNSVLTSTQISELFNGRVNIYTNPTSGGSGGGGALSQTGSIASTKFDDYKSYVLAGLNGSSTTGGNGGSGSSAYNTRFTTTIKGTSLSVGLGGSGVSGTPTPATKTNYGDGGDGNGGSGYGGLVIVRFKANTNYLQVKAIKNNGNSGLIINANETISGVITPYQLKIYPFQDTYTTTGITTRGYTFQTSDGITNTQLLNLFSYFGGRIGVKTLNPSSTLEVNGDITCKTFNVIGQEQYGIVCQVVNQHETGEASINVFAGQGTNYGGLSLVYQPSQNLGYISCSKSLKIKTANDAANSYIYINDSTGNIGIGKADPVSKLEVNGTTTTNYLSASIIYAGEVQANIINSLNGNIVNNNNLFSSNIYIYNQIDMQNKPIYNCSYLYGGVSWANEWKATTNIYHRDDQGRDRIYFKNDTTGSPANHFTLFKSGGTTHSFADKDDVQYCLLDRFGITSYFEVVSSSGYDNVGVLDGVSVATYVFRKMYLRLSTFTEVHRCFIEDELYTNYDDFINEFIGRVVVSKGKIKTALKEADKEWQILEGKDGITIDDSHPVVELSRTKKNKAVVGVITKRNQNADMPGRLVINSLGETGIWVVNTGGCCIETGDLITTSDELGYGERQTLDDETADDIIKNYTIGKVMIDCNFELDNPNYKCEVIDEKRDLRRAFLPIFIYSG